MNNEKRLIRPEFEVNKDYCAGTDLFECRYMQASRMEADSNRCMLFDERLKSRHAKHVWHIIPCGQCKDARLDDKVEAPFSGQCVHGVAIGQRCEKCNR